METRTEKPIKDKVCEDIKILTTLLSISEEYGHLTLTNVIDRFRAKIKYLTELEQQHKKD